MAEAEQKKGLEGVVIADTRLSKVMGDIGRLIYAGYDIQDLAENASFEEVVYLLWHNVLPTKAQLDEFRQTLIGDMALPAPMLTAMKTYPLSAHPMGVLRTAVSALGLHDPDAEDNSPEANKRKAQHLTAKIVADFHPVQTAGSRRQPFSLRVAGFKRGVRLQHGYIGDDVRE